ncbi:hypothetical protein GIB67_026415, partial [Kingdonia uniflora]
NLALIESSFLQVLAGNGKMAIWKDEIAELTVLIRGSIEVFIARSVFFDMEEILDELVVSVMTVLADQNVRFAKGGEEVGVEIHKSVPNIFPSSAPRSVISPDLLNGVVSAPAESGKVEELCIAVSLLKPKLTGVVASESLFLRKKLVKILLEVQLLIDITLGGRLLLGVPDLVPYVLDLVRNVLVYIIVSDCEHFFGMPELLAKPQLTGARLFSSPNIVDNLLATNLVSNGCPVGTSVLGIGGGIGEGTEPGNRGFALGRDWGLGLDERIDTIGRGGENGEVDLMGPCKPESTSELMRGVDRECVGHVQGLVLFGTSKVDLMTELKAKREVPDRSRFPVLPLPLFIDSCDTTGNKEVPQSIRGEEVKAWPHQLVMRARKIKWRWNGNMDHYYYCRNMFSRK